MATLTKRESDLLRRALDKATTPAEAATAAKAFIESLRKRGLDGYAFARPDSESRPTSPSPQPQQEWTPPQEPQPPPQQEWTQEPPPRRNSPSSQIRALGCLIFFAALLIFHNFFAALLLSWLLSWLLSSDQFRHATAVILGLCACLGLLGWAISMIPNRPSAPVDPPGLTYPTPYPTPFVAPVPTPPERDIQPTPGQTGTGVHPLNIPPRSEADWTQAIAAWNQDHQPKVPNNAFGRIWLTDHLARQR